MNRYSQARALWGIFRSSLIATRRNVSSLVFGLIFPLVFIVIFGYLGQGTQKIDVAIAAGSDINNPIYQALSHQPNLNLKTNLNAEEIEAALKKGQLPGVITIHNDGNPLRPHYQVGLTTSSAAPQGAALLSMMVSGISDRVNLVAAGAQNGFVTVNKSEVAGRQYRTIDFILPGMLGFSLLSAGIFGTAFTFLTLRQTLVIKRFFTTPVSRLAIILGESLSRLTVALMQAVVIVGVGYYMFHFTLIYGFVTLIEILGLSAVGLIVFLGFGLIISSVAKDDRSIAPMAQLVTLPQFLLAGTFFPIDQLPVWLQRIANILPLTYLNDAMRKVAFEGAGLDAIRTDMLWLVGWAVVIYAVTVRVFRWEAS